MTYSIWDENREVNGLEQALLRLANIPEFQWQEADLRPDECDVEAFDRLSNIREKITDFAPNNLLICGKNLGCGKTEWALKLMLTYIERNSYRIKFVDRCDVDRYTIAYFCQVVPFLVQMKQFGNNKRNDALYDRIERSELVVFDDISALPMSNYDYNILYAIVENRLWNGLPTIYTTNITDYRDLQANLGERLAERIWKTSKIVQLRGEGYRGA